MGAIPSFPEGEAVGCLVHSDSVMLQHTLCQDFGSTSESHGAWTGLFNACSCLVKAMVV